ncbi:UNVERIFIED_CONTAM: hypothetical protein NCL1_54265 [Trichonephila clavipes]
MELSEEVESNIRDRQDESCKKTLITIFTIFFTLTFHKNSLQICGINNDYYTYDDGTSDMEDGGHRMTCPPHPDSVDIDELSETECDRHHNSWIVIRESFEEDLIRRVPRVC